LTRGGAARAALALLPLSAALSACWLETHPFTIRVEGTPGTRFEGSSRAVQRDGSNAVDTLTGVVPARYEAVGNIVSVTLRAEGAPGSVRVEVLRDGRVVARGASGGPGTVLTVSTP